MIICERVIKRYQMKRYKEGLLILLLLLCWCGELSWHHCEMN